MSNEDMINEIENVDAAERVDEPNDPIETPEEVDSDSRNNDPEDEGDHEPEDHGSDEGDTFPRPYVEKLRKENAKYRERAQQADELAHKLHAALVRLDGRLADPGDLKFAPEHLEDEETLSAAITDLVTRKPGLKARQVAGDVGAGARGPAAANAPDLISIIQGL